MGHDQEWGIIDYEWDMVVGLTNWLPKQDQLDRHLKNAVVESLVLHTRILTDILLSRSKRTEDIQLTTLMDSFKSPTIAELEVAYGNGSVEGTPAWQFNKLLAHATTHRSDSYDYLGALKIVLPIVEKLLGEIRQPQSKPSSGYASFASARTC
jgi:hypothetical protein